MEEQISDQKTRSKWWLWLVAVLSFLLLVGLIGIWQRKINSELPFFDTNKNNDGLLIWVPDSMTQPLPAGASKTRLVMPYTGEELMVNNAPIVGFGVHSGQHIEGLDHVWIPIIKDGISKAWGEGKITGVQEIGYQGEEFMVIINYGDGLECVNGELSKSLVKKGQRVKAGDPIGTVRDMGGFADVGEIEIYCSDSNLKHGTITTNGNNAAVAVSPFDYLANAEKTRIETLYEEKVINLFLTTGKAQSGWQPTEPYLTNKMMIHEPNKIIGEWFLVSQKYDGEALSILTFTESNNKYYSGNSFQLRAETFDNFEVKKYIDGDYRVTYEGNRGKLVLREIEKETGIGYDHYAIFEISEDAGADADNGFKRAQMKFEYSEKPITEFSNKALIYQARGIRNPRWEAARLGLQAEE